MGKKRAQTQQSFTNVIASQTVNKFGPVIKQEVAKALEQFAFKYNDALRDLFIKVSVLEDVLVSEETNKVSLDGIPQTVSPSITREELAKRFADKQDVIEGYSPAEVVEANDRVRVSVQTKAKDQTEFSEVSRLQIDAVGSGQTLGTEFENHIVGMNILDAKSVILKGKSEEDLVNGTEVIINVDKISRRV